ncbi:MAG TPA: GNAT family N-acetyltransferase [Dermatophilaceae bacterium]|nr:GNAT family N-acetyltransferase [Dermatophilaceae bacterium]
MTGVPRVDEIQTPRLRMRRAVAADHEAFTAMNADPQVMRFFPAPLGQPGSDALADRIEAGFAERGFGMWTLERRSDRAFLGVAGLQPMRGDVPGAGQIEVGWRLAAYAWHNGYATEAAHAAVTVGFERLGLDEIWSLTAVLNEPSRAVMRRIGMHEVVRFEHPALPEGHPLRPHVSYRLERPSA